MAFADSLAVLWEVMIGIAVLGLLSVLLMRELPLQNVLDEEWGLRDSGLIELQASSGCFQETDAKI